MPMRGLKIYPSTIEARLMLQSTQYSRALILSPDTLSSVGRWFQSLADELNRSWFDALAQITLTPTHLRGLTPTRALGIAGDASRAATYMTSPHTISDTRFRVTRRLSYFPSFDATWQGGWVLESFGMPSPEKCTWCGTTIRRLPLNWTSPWADPMGDLNNWKQKLSGLAPSM